MVVRQKKEAHLSAWERLSGEYGDAWVWTAFDPCDKVVLNFRVGKRTQTEADAFVAALKARTDGHIPLFTSDELPHYDGALLAAYGALEPWVRPPGRKGRPRKARLLAPAELVYVQLVRHRRKGRVVRTSTRIVFGQPEQVWERLRQSPVSHHVNLAFVERNNGTLRQYNSRLRRKSNSFAKRTEALVGQLHLMLAYYHFVRPHGGLRVRDSNATGRRRWTERTPAMSAGWTDHIWSLRELLTHRVSSQMT